MKKFLWLVLFVFTQIAMANGGAPFLTRDLEPVKNQESFRLVTVVMQPGSLRDNIERIAGDNGWTRVVWSNTKDYNWVGQTKVTGESFAAVMKKIIEDYPLQAVFYLGNHVLLIQPRTIQAGKIK